MISDELFGLLITSTFVAVCCLVVLQLRISPRLKQLVCAALVLRVVGALLYHIVFTWSSYGGGDFVVYYERGLLYAERMMLGDFAMFTDPSEWWEYWHGTQFMFFSTGIVLSVVGPSLRGAFVVFALLGFVGLIGFAVAYRRCAGDVPLPRYLAWLFLFPSLWFWPATLGKDAVLLMGLGLAVWGIVGRQGRVQWLPLAAGLFFVFAIRPQVAAVVAVSLVIGHVLTGARHGSGAQVAQKIVVAVAGFWVLQFGLASMGIGFGSEGIGEYVTERSASTAVSGRSAVETGSGVGGAAMGLVNVLFRPFPWEARGFAALISSLEIWGFWVLLWFHRRNAVAVLKQVRSNRMVAVGVPFVLLYATLLGMTVANMGILARQRIFVFPFLFLLFVAVQRAGEQRNVPRARGIAPARAPLPLARSG
jgi:hypothetical protein